MKGLIIFFVVVFFLIYVPVHAQESNCDSVDWSSNASIYLDEFTRDLETLDATDVPAMTELYSRIMDARHYYEDLEVCEDLREINTLMIQVLDDFQDKLFYTMSTTARAEGSQINGSIIQNTVQPRYEMHLAELNAEIDQLQDTSAVDDSSSSASAIVELESSKSNDILGPFDIESGFYFVEWDITDDTETEGYMNLTLEWDTGELLLVSFDSQGRSVFYLEEGNHYANIEFSYADDYSIALYPAPIEPITATSASGKGNTVDVFGPIELRAGQYILTYSTVADTDPNSITYFDLRYRVFDEYIDGAYGSDSGDVSGQQLIDVRGGLYFLKYEITGVTEWEFSVSPVN